MPAPSPDYNSRRFLSTVITRALSDAEEGDLKALCWLASTAATPYFEALDFPQSTVLARSGWRSWARRAIYARSELLAPAQRDILSRTEAYLASLTPR